MAAVPLEPAFVLHRRRYGDTSLLLELLTRDQGRLAAVAKGAAQARRGKAGLLQPFAPLLVVCRGRGEVVTLTAVEAAARPHVLPGRQLYCGLYLNELLLQLLARHDPHPEVFANYALALAELSDATPPDGPLRRFELKLLEALGFGLQLTCEADGVTPVDPARRYHYRVDAGPVATEQGDGFAGITLLDLARGEMHSPVARTEARRLMREVLHHHLEGRPLRSRELFRADR